MSVPVRVTANGGSPTVTAKDDRAEPPELVAVTVTGLPLRGAAVSIHRTPEDAIVAPVPATDQVTPASAGSPATAKAAAALTVCAPLFSDIAHIGKGSGGDRRGVGDGEAGGGLEVAPAELVAVTRQRRVVRSSAAVGT